ncbi:protein S100-A12-like [Emydura macquarii macquarii]|uniref:protein S100-A12-like n=1 Tax=Emydura macquarii macquarii TaxID=1129001 RepID=UPI003529E3B1
MTTELEKSLEDAVNTYHRYAIKDPQDDYLHKKEFKLLLKENVQQFLRDTLPYGMKEDAYIDKLFTDADKDSSGYLKFTEFLHTLALLAINAHDNSHNTGDPDRGGRGHGHGHSH